MSSQFKKIFLPVFIILVLFNPELTAQFQIKHSIFSNGAGRISNANHSIRSTLGQPAIGLMANAEYRLYAGFWYYSDLLVSIADEMAHQIPHTFELFQNYPNPFNPSTTIRYALPMASDVRIDIYNLLGEHVATVVNGPYTIGLHEVKVNAQHLSTGYYLYRIRAGKFQAVKKMILTK